MIIDFHTHIFPEKIAERALGKLSSIINIPPSFNGCAEGLRENMKAAGVDVSVILPVVTDEKQFDSILRFASMINETYKDDTTARLISFAGITPTDPNFSAQLLRIREAGFIGVKIHPNYQNIDFNDIRVKRMITRASELGLMVLTHAGFDPVTPEHEFCSPDMIVEVLKDTETENLILAHMGNNENYDESEEKLCGRKVYIDTSYSILRMSEEQFTRMVRKHGADRILFASDSPWASSKACIDRLKASTLTDEEKEMIFSGNARRILHLS